MCVHCLNCLHSGYITDAYGEELKCPKCRAFLVSEIKKGSARIALMKAREAAEKFARDLGDQRKEAV